MIFLATFLLFLVTNLGFFFIGRERARLEFVRAELAARIQAREDEEERLLLETTQRIHKPETLN